jgi:hypothetical protein
LFSYTKGFLLLRLPDTDGWLFRSTDIGEEEAFGLSDTKNLWLLPLLDAED